MLRNFTSRLAQAHKICAPLHNTLKFVSPATKFSVYPPNMNHLTSSQVRNTTVLCVRKGKDVVIMADGQVTMGNSVVKHNTNKLRTLGNGEVIGGFSGTTADAITLFELLDQQLEQYPGQLLKNCIELSKKWRVDKYLSRLDAVMIVADKHKTLLLSGTGDVLEPEEGILGIGSGGSFASAAARALARHTDKSAKEICEIAMKIAAEICIYTNDKFTMLSLPNEAE